jgi:hypothetical protein
MESPKKGPKHNIIQIIYEKLLAVLRLIPEKKLTSILEAITVQAHRNIVEFRTTSLLKEGKGIYIFDEELIRLLEQSANEIWMISPDLSRLFNSEGLDPDFASNLKNGTKYVFFLVESSLDPRNQILRAREKELLLAGLGKLRPNLQARVKIIEHLSEPIGTDRVIVINPMSEFPINLFNSGENYAAHKDFPGLRSLTNLYAQNMEV